MRFMNSLMPVRHDSPYILPIPSAPCGLPIWYAPDDGDGGQAGDAGGVSNPTAPGGRLDSERLIAKHGSAEAALRALAFKLDEVEGDNAKYRQQLNEMRGKLPGEGTVVLDSEQAAVWTAYQALGEPDAIKQLQTDYSASQRNELYRTAAEAHGYKADVLRQLPGADSLQIVIKEIEADGKKLKTAVVSNGDGKETTLPDYVKGHWEAFLPSLVAQQQAAASGTPWPKQDVGAQGAPPDIVAQRLAATSKAQAERKNPLQK